jgi:hypothetical protein
MGVGYQSHLRNQDWDTITRDERVYVRPGDSSWDEN